jgi:antitoxin PrlF
LPFRGEIAVETVACCKLTSKCQTTIPEKIRSILAVGPGDSVAFDLTPDQKVILRKATPLDLDFAGALEGTLSEWLSDHDEEAYGGL